MAWSRDSRLSTNVEGHEVEGQGHDIKRDPSRVKQIILWCISESCFTAHHNECARVCNRVVA